MPHLHGDQAKESDISSDGSVCSENVDGQVELSICTIKAAESAPNKLLNLAAVAEKHANSSVDIMVAKEETKEAEGTTHCSLPGMPPEQLQHPEEGPETPAAIPTMGHRWGLVGHLPRYPGYFPQPPILVYPPGHPSGRSPIPAEHSPSRLTRRGPPPPPRGGFPMWAGLPRPPYHTHPLGVVLGPASLPPHFRRPVPPPFSTHQLSSADDIHLKGGGAAKRPSLGSPPKSILKKPRTETDPAPVSPQANEGAVEDASVKTMARSTLATLAASAASISEASQILHSDAAETQSKKIAVMVEKSSSEEEEMTLMNPPKPKQRIISPASSNEYPKTDCDDEMSFCVDESPSPGEHGRMMYSEALTGSPHGPYFSNGVHPFRMGYIHPPMPPTMHAPPHPHMAFPHPGMRPFHFGMHVPPMYPPPRNLSTRGRGPGFASMHPAFARARMDSSFSPEHQEQACKRSDQHVSSTVQPIPSVATSARKSPTVDCMEATTDEATSGKRCVPLNPPVPSKYWTDDDINKEVALPDFHRLVNFPDLLVKGRGAGCDGDASSGIGANKKRCVMCGQLRVSATFVRAKKAKADNAAADERPIQPAANISGNSGGDSSNHIIPRQNKGVCTACDVTVWVALELDGLEIKWCKGCKNFRPWCHFGDKSLATKCLRCRDRQKEKYAMQKSVNRRQSDSCSPDSGAEEKDEANDLHCSLAVVAANGLRNLMNAR